MDGAKGMECVFILGKAIYGLKQSDFENERDSLYGKIKLRFHTNLFYYNTCVVHSIGYLKLYRAVPPWWFIEIIVRLRI